MPGEGGASTAAGISRPDCGRICPRLHNEQDLTAQRNGLTALDVTEDLIYVDRSLIGATEHGQDCP